MEMDLSVRRRDVLTGICALVAAPTIARILTLEPIRANDNRSAGDVMTTTTVSLGFMGLPFPSPALLAEYCTQSPQRAGSADL